MRKLLTTLFLFAVISNLSAEISVKSFRKLQNDLDARVNAPIKDFSGDVSAIIKVVTTQTGFTFDCGSIGIVKTVNKSAEIWIYIPYGAKRITITHPRLGLLRDYLFPEPIDKATVYEMVLTTGKVITSVEEEITSQWLLIKTEPAKAMIYLNDEFVKTGEYQAKLKSGSYTYRVEMPLYHTEAGTIEITDAKKELKVTLKPAFGTLQVTSTPESTATVIIDGKEQSQTTPCLSEALPSGEHTVQVIKEMYQPTVQKTTVIDGQTTKLDFVLKPNFAELTISAPVDATVYVNNQQKSIGTWIGRLNTGIYSLEVQRDKHRPAKQDIEVKAGDKRVVDLQPLPIYGSLDIMTTPAGANISINGEVYGTTPNTINNLLIGEYTIQLSNVGFESVNKKVTVYDGKSTEIVEIMSKLQVSRNSNNNKPNSILRNDVDTMSYCLGLNVGTDFAKNIKGIPGGKANKDILILGFSTAMKEEKGLINTEISQEYFKKYIEKAQKDNKATINKEGKRITSSILTNEVDSMSYCLGLNVGTDFAKNIKGIPGGKANKDLLIKGFSSAMRAEKLLFDTAYASVYFKKYIEKAQMKDAAIKKAEGEKFLSENKFKEGVITTQTGLQYQVLISKNGIKPQATDSVKVHYQGFLINGTKFDSSIDRGEPIIFPLNQVIPGWTEGVQLMSVGSKYKFYVPYNLGYGEKGAGNGAIPAYATLIFEVELLEVKHKKN